MDKIPLTLIPKEKIIQKLNEQLVAGESLAATKYNGLGTFESLLDKIQDWSDSNFMILSTSFDGDELLTELNEVAKFRRSTTGSFKDEHRRLLLELAENLKFIQKLLLLLTSREINDTEHSVLSVKKENSVQNKDAVFIVHGHDNTTKEMVARFVLQMGLKPIILHEQPNLGKTIIEKFETYSKVAFALVLLSPDDIGYPAESQAEAKFRARQNVIFELGYFVGLIGRERVCALYKGNVEIPSDYHGVVYIPIDEAGAWKIAVAKDMRSAGIEIDLNRTM